MPGFSKGLADCLIQSGNGVIQLLGAAAQWGHQNHGIQNRAGEQSMLAGSQADLFSDPLICWEGLATRVPQLNSGDEPALSGFVDLRVLGLEIGEAGFQMGDLGWEPSEGLFIFEDLKVGKGGSTAEWIGGVAVAVVESLVRVAQEGFVDGFGGEGGGKRQGAAGETFGEAEVIGNDVLLLAGEQGSGATEAGHDFVEDELNAMVVTPTAQLFKHALWPGAHLVHALDQWLNDHCRQGARVELIEFGEILNMLDIIAVLFEALEKAADAPHRRGAQGVAVIAVGKGGEAGAVFRSGLLAVLDGHLQRTFDGGRSVVGKEDTLESVGREEGAELGGEFDCTWMGGAEEGAVIEGGRLFLDGCCDGGVAVAVDVGPDR